MHLLSLRTVLAATDLDSASVAAIETARRLATAAGATLHVAHVVRGAPTTASRDAVDAFVRRGGVATDPRRTHVLEGDPAHAIRLLADRIKADVVVLGPHRERPGGASGSALGSTALAIVTDSFAPCLIARKPLAIPLERVVVAIDLSDTARGALVVGLSWASALRAPPGGPHAHAASTMLVLHVSRTGADAGVKPRPADGSATLSREIQRIRADAGNWANVDVEEVTRSSDDPAEAIAEAGVEDRADLIVLGTRGLGIDRTGRLGSVSANVVRMSAVPVLLVPPAVWISHASS